jgi:hypothetical protein
MRRAEAALEALVSLLSSPPLLSPATALSLLHLATAGNGDESGNGNGNDKGKKTSSSRKLPFSSPTPPATPVPLLAEACRSLAVSHFATCAQEDPRGLKSLTFEALLSVLGDDALAASEEEAFCAAALWASSSNSFATSNNPSSIEALEDLEDSPEARRRAAAFPALLARGVRLSTMPREALFRLDGHACVRGSRAATRAVARALISSFHRPRVPTELERRQMFIVAVASREEGGRRGRREGEGEGDDANDDDGEEEFDAAEERREEEEEWQQQLPPFPREVVGIGVHAGRRSTATAALAAAARGEAAGLEEPTPCGPLAAARRRRGGGGGGDDFDDDDESGGDDDGSDFDATPSTAMVLLPSSPSETLRTGRTMPPGAAEAAEATAVAATAAAAANAAAVSASAFLLRRSFSGISVAEGGGGAGASSPPPLTAASGAAAAATARASSLAPASLTGCDASPPRRGTAGAAAENGGAGANRPLSAAAAAGEGSGRPRARSPRKRLCLE